MKKVSLLKKLKLYFFYRKSLLANKTELLQNYGAKVDYVSRVYTVLNIPKELYDEPYNLRKQDIDSISKKYIREYSSELSQYFDKIGLTELYDFYQVEKVDKFSYLLVFGFSLFNTDKFARNLFFKVIPISVLILLVALLFLI